MFSNAKIRPIFNKSYDLRSSFAVCLTIVFSCAISFFCGFLFSSFTFKENYSLVYENLLAEMIEKEDKFSDEEPSLHYTYNENTKNYHKNQVNSQAILAVFSASGQFYEKQQACDELKNIVLKKETELSDNTMLFLKEHCY